MILQCEIVDKHVIIKKEKRKFVLREKWWVLMNTVVQYNVCAPSIRGESALAFQSQTVVYSNTTLQRVHLKACVFGKR